MALNYLMSGLLFFTIILSLEQVSASNSSSKKSASDKYKLLCWLPVPIKSHHGLFRPLLISLAERGHHVTVVTPFPISDPPKNYHQIVIQNQYHVYKEFFSQRGWFAQFTPLITGNIGRRLVPLIFKDPKVKEFLNSDHQFDGIILESMIMNEAFIGLHHKYEAPVIDILPPANYHWAYYLYGIPYDPSYIVELQTSFSDRMTLWERIQNTVLSLSTRAVTELYYMPTMQELMDKHLRYPGWQTRPSMMEMLSNISLALINTHFSISYPYPMPPNAKEIAGINLPPLKPLPKDLQNLMDSSSNGVIIFSMGSHINMDDAFGPDKIEMLKKIFGGLKQNVLWKWELEFFDVPSNIILTKWFPQTDILAHKNCKLFITHGGFHSLLESIYHGVPMISIPYFGDQMKNARIVSHHGLGIELSKDNITEESITWSINQLLTDNRYKDNAIKRSQIYRDTAINAMDSAIYWIEYVLRHKGAHHLKSAIVTMPWYQQAMLDIYLSIAAIIFLTVIVVYVTIKYTVKLIHKLVFSRNIKDKQKNKID